MPSASADRRPACCFSDRCPAAAGCAGSNPDWLIKSNRESGDGFSDILIMPEDPDAGIVIEVKYAKEMKELDAACEAAITQIKDKRYDETLRDEGRSDILAYGIAFCRKRCRVVGEKF